MRIDVGVVAENAFDTADAFRGDGKRRIVMTDVIETGLARRTTELAPMQEYIGPVMTVDQAIARYNVVADFTRRVLREGMDYGTIPGTAKPSKDGVPSSKNNTLLKAGAEKLCTLFGLVPDFEDYRIVEDWSAGLFYYAFRCKLSRHGQLIASAIGSANSREKKYRRAARVCPDCGASTIKKSKYPPKHKPQAEPGWYCEDKSGGCGRNFEAADPKIVDQKTVADPSDACDQINTLQKMAQKRALVAAALIATNASEFFTQDVEDMAIVEQPDPPRGNAPQDRQNQQQNQGQKNQQQEEQQPDLNDDAIFMQEAIKHLMARGFTQEGAEEAILATIDKAKKPLAELAISWRRGVINAAWSGKFDKGLHKETPAADATAPTPEDPTTALVELPWEEFLAKWYSMIEDKCGRADFNGGVGAAALKLGKKGKEASISREMRKRWVEASLDDRFDFLTGTVHQEAAAPVS